MSEITRRPENDAVLECLQIIAPGVKWTPALASTFERMLMKRGFQLSPLKAPTQETEG